MLPPAGAGWGSELPCCGHRVCTVEAPRAAAGLRVGREMPPPRVTGVPVLVTWGGETL